MVTQMLDDQANLVPSKYNIDKHLKKMSIRSTEGMALQHVVPLANIQEIYRIEDGEGLFPNTIQKLKAPDVERILLIMYTDDRGQSAKFCFFESTTVDKE